jgi:ubiquinone/menaquinone biosynthesis C-methylase UbiE
MALMIEVLCQRTGSGYNSVAMVEFLKRKIQYLSLSNEAGRHAWMRAKIHALPTGLKVLDIGAGEQPYRSDAAHLDYVAQDFNEYQGEGNHKGWQTGTWDTHAVEIVSDILKMPVPSGSFDAAFCTEVFEHIPDPIAALDEINRVLKPGGTLLLTAPFMSATHFAPYHFCTGYNKYFYLDNLPKHGFTITEIKANGNYFGYLVSFLSMFPGVLKTYVPNRFNRYLFMVLGGILVVPLMILTNIINHFARGSEEVVCFGYFVEAKKKH